MAPITPSILREWPRLDPRTGITVFALWALFFGSTLAGPGEIFSTSPSFDLIAGAGVSEHTLGYLMLASAGALYLALRPRTGLGFRLIAGWACGTFWTVVGGLLLIGGGMGGLFSVNGAFGLCGGVGCILTIHQWLVQT